MENKFRPDHVDEVHVNNFIYNSFGSNAERRHRYFKAFFSLQDPSIKVPERSLFPNWKVCPILKSLNYICPLIWLLGIAFSIDEMTMRFQGKRVDKIRITYKNEGDGFQADALCQDGFTYQICMINDPDPLKYIKEVLSPLHSKVMALFDSLRYFYHHCAMENLYNSFVFFKKAFNHKFKVLCHSVTRKGMCGIPSSVKQ